MQHSFFFRSLAVHFALALSFAFASSSHANTFSVTTTNDSGTGSLRTAITNANATAGANTITFNLTGTPPFTINLTSALPAINNPVTIAGTNQPGYSNAPVVELNGVGISAVGAVGLQLNSGSSPSIIQGLAINRFNYEGIILNGASNIIQGNFIGTDPGGTLARGNFHDGILVTSQGNLIGGTAALARNIISGNGNAGICITNNANGNTIQGNWIGVSSYGTNALGNTNNGITIYGCSGNAIGGTNAGAGNVISGNIQNGIWLTGNTATANIIVGNFIGTDVTGKFALPNTNGLYLNNSPANTIGLDTNAGNLISGNLQHGILLVGGSSSNLVQGNLIGLAIGGTNALPNQQDGIFINGGVANTIGGKSTAARNIISGNGINGVFIGLTNDRLNVIAANYIGTDITGERAVPNVWSGVLVQGGTNTIGYSKSIGIGNVISGNGQIGVWLYGTNSSAKGNLVAGNFIGLDWTGTNSLGNGNAGLEITSSAGNQIGGSGSQANVISGNANAGIYITGASATNNLIQGNYIGTDATGSSARANVSSGIYAQSVGSNTIGGLSAGMGNVISGNSSSGIVLTNTADFLIAGNYIGLNAAGTAAIKNFGEGVVILHAASTNWIGGSNSAARNVISGNGTYGVNLNGSTAQVVQGNYIGTDASGSYAVANSYEGIILQSSTNNLIGGIGAGNLVSGNSTDNSDPGVYIYSATGNTIQGNLVGVNADGTAGIGNIGNGITLNNSTSNLIGGTVTGACNIISANGANGLYFNNASWNTVQGNFIGVAADAISPLGNTWHNVQFDTGSTNNILGGLTTGAGNNIAYAKTIPTTYAGVRVRTNAFNNLISGNSIFKNAGLGIDIGNQGVNPNIPGEIGVAANNANRLQNYPILSNAASGTQSGALATLIRGSFDSATNKTYSLEFFASPSGNTNGYGEGQVFLGQTSLTLGAATSTNFSITLPASVPTNWVVTATATDSANNTSEFSNWFTNIAKIPVPVAALATYTRTAGLSLVISLSNLATNWSDASGYPVTLAAMNLTTTNGVTLLTNSTMIQYPNNSPNQADQFSYTITDGYGTNTGLVSIAVVGSVYGQIKGITVSNGIATASFNGIPGWPYNVLRTTNLLSNWVTLLTTNAPDNGLFQFKDTFSDLGGVPPSAFYQLSWHP